MSLSEKWKPKSQLIHRKSSSGSGIHFAVSQRYSDWLSKIRSVERLLCMMRSNGHLVGNRSEKMIFVCLPFLDGPDFTTVIVGEFVCNSRVADNSTSFRLQDILSVSTTNHWFNECMCLQYKDYIYCLYSLIFIIHTCS